MDQDLAVRLANEGVPVRAIARATQAPSADIRLQLERARSTGHLIDLPCDDWPSGYPREQRLLQLTRLVVKDSDSLQAAIRQIFRASPIESQMLLLLIQNQEVHQDRLRGLSGSASEGIRVHLYRLRRYLQAFKLEIKTLYGYGYRMSPEHRRKALDLILDSVAVAA
jgi:DNA-binding response OmpR family regulator